MLACVYSCVHIIANTRKPEKLRSSKYLAQTLKLELPYNVYLQLDLLNVLPNKHPWSEQCAANISRQSRWLLSRPAHQST